MAETKEKAPSIAEGFANLSSEMVVNALMESNTPTKAATTPPADASATKEKTPAEKTPAAAIPEAKTDEKANTDKKAVDKKAPDKPAAEKAPDGNEKTKEQLDVEKLEADKNKTPEQIEAEKKAAEEAEDKAPVLDFKLPGEEGADKNSEGESNGWKELAKELEIEITEDKFDEFKTKLDEHYKNKYEINLGKYNAETQAVISFLEAGGTVEEFVAPTKKIDEFLSLDKETLVEQDLIARKMPDDIREIEMKRLVDTGEIDAYDFKVREALTIKKGELQANVIKLKTDATKRQDTYKQSTSTEESAAIKKTLNTVSEFMETPLKPEVKDFITKKWEKGEYANIFNDPKVKAEFLLWHEFGKQAQTNLKEKAFSEARLKYKNDRHNIPPTPNAGGTGARAASQTAKAEGNWDALKGFTELTS